MKVRVTLVFAFLSALSIFSGLGLVPSAVNASVIYSQAPDQLRGRASDVATPEETADNFTLGSAATVRSITWWGAYDFGDGTDPPLGTENFTIRFYSDAAGGPSSNPSATLNVGGSVGREATGNTVAGFVEYQYQVDSADLVLAAGTHYLSIVDDTRETDDDIRESGDGKKFFWESGTAGDSNDWFRLSIGSGDWVRASTMSHAFALNGDLLSVPEPTTLVLLGLGLVGLGFTKRRQPICNVSAD
jgi:hypothetical protein